MPVNINTVGGCVIGRNEGSVDLSTQLVLNDVVINEKYYDMEDIIGVKSGTIHTETNRSVGVSRLYDPQLSNTQGYNNSGWFIRAETLYIEELSEGDYLAFFSVATYGSGSWKPVIRVIRNKPSSNICTLIKEYVITDYGNYLYNLDHGSTRVVKHNDLYYLCMVAPSTWDIWLVSLNVTNGVSTDLVKITTTIGTGNNYSITGMCIPDDTEDIIWIAYSTSNNGNTTNLVKYNCVSNTLSGPYGAPSYTSPAFACKYSTVPNHQRAYTSSYAYERDWTFPLISPTYRFGEYSFMIGNKIVIAGHQEYTKVVTSQRYAYSISFALFSYTDNGNTLTMTLEQDNITSIYNYVDDDSDQYGQWSTAYGGHILDNNYVFGISGITRGGVATSMLSDRGMSIISAYEFMYIPDIGEYGVRTLYEVPVDKYMSYCYSDASIGKYDPIILVYASEISSSDSLSYDTNANREPFNICFLSKNNHLGFLEYELDGYSGQYNHVYKVSATLENMSTSSDSRYGEFTYNAKNGDILYGSDPITDIHYIDDGSTILVNSRTYTIQKDGTIVIRIVHDTFRYRPFILVRDRSGTFMNLQIERDGNKISGKFISAMMINDYIVSENGIQTIEDDAFLNERLYVDMGGI